MFYRLLVDHEPEFTVGEKKGNVGRFGAVFIGVDYCHWYFSQFELLLRNKYENWPLPQPSSYSDIFSPRMSAVD